MNTSKVSGLNLDSKMPWLTEPLKKIECGGSANSIFIGGNHHGKTDAAMQFMEECISDITKGMMIPKKVMAEMAQWKPQLDHNYAAVKYNQLQNFTNAALGQPWGHTPEIRDRAHNIERALRNLATPCRACGNRPGIWVSEEPQFREFRVRLKCHGEVEYQAITDQSLAEFGDGVIHRLHPFENAVPKVAPQPTPRPAITITDAPRLIRIED